MARGLESIPAHFAQAMVHPAHVFHKQPIQNHQLSRHACLWTVEERWSSNYMDDADDTLTRSARYKGQTSEKARK